MKKIFTMILVAAGLLSFNAASAQKRNDRYGNQDGYQVNQQNSQWNQGGRHQSNGQWDQSGRNQSRERDYGYNNQRGRNNDYQRQAEYDRMNRECDNRVDVYRNDRRLDNYERNRRIQEVEYERQQKAKAFGKGMVVGGVAAILIGVMIGGGR
jgi:hypothetical protein